MTATSTIAIAAATSTTIVAREVWLNNFVERARPVFEAIGHPLPLNLRVSVGLPPTGYRSKVIGVCFHPEVSADNHWEIFISPLVSEGDARIADILTHELIHTVTDPRETGEKAHGKTFGTIARALGLTGPLTATVADTEWMRWALPILTDLGSMDFGALAGMTPAKKQPTWGIKIECPDCGWLARVSKKHIAPYTHLNCPNPECDGIMISEYEAE